MHSIKFGFKYRMQISELKSYMNPVIKNLDDQTRENKINKENLKQWNVKKSK